MTANPKTKADLDLLTLVEGGEVVSQRVLSKRIGVAVGLINVLVKRAMKKGYVKARSAPARRYAYYLTPKGFSEKSRLVTEYLEASLGFFRYARGEYEELFQRAERCGQKRLVLIGAGELSEIGVLAAQGTGVSILAVLDQTRSTDRIHTYPVVQFLDEVSGYDAVVLTDMASPQQTYDWLATVLEQRQILVPSLLRVIHNRDALQDSGAKTARTV